ncbi:hypothetical protein [Undibacterium fentianense]|uniref:Lipoprotein n=1 Tax=Undibacterium fentianense TaxID=2828728 RepID=A0A941E5I4_9BURK|nr:hypothetical protein [Undibacterium fentianense]MBR7801532.1 hypothetical protein [Undibacterium fentianense]
MEKRIVIFVISLAIAISLSCALLVSIVIVDSSLLPQENITEVWEGGDGEGFNLRIEFFGSKYLAIWRGCLGEYGRAQGDYVKILDHIHFNPRIETGMMASRFRSMQIVRNEDQTYLVDDNDKDAMKYLRYSGLRKIIDSK